MFQAGYRNSFFDTDEFWRRVNAASFFVPRASFRKPRRRSVTLESQRGHFSVQAGPSPTRPLSWRGENPRALCLAPALSRVTAGAQRGSTRRANSQIPILLLDLYPHLNPLRNRL